MGETGKKDPASDDAISPADRLDSAQEADEEVERETKKLDELHEDVRRARDAVEDQH